MASLVRTIALWAAVVAAAPSAKSLKSDISILIDNDLQGADSPSASSGVILLSRRSHEDAVSSCEALGEQLWSPELKTASIQPNLDYLKYQGKIGNSSLLWIASSDDEPRAIGGAGDISTAEASLRLPALCTQSAPFSNVTFEDTSDKWQVSVHSNNEDYVGYRDRLSFRFFGIRYAPEPKRFTYSVPYKGSGETVKALEWNAQCAQGNSGSEDCLFLNIWTSHLPKPGCKPKSANLKPVMFWIHGGAFTGGTANDITIDGGNIVSRGDVVLVATNYRLSTLGFLALKDGVTNGNFGLADQINALDWVRAHIQDFGGDPDRITIFGQSAGAGSVRALMASPKAAGKFVNAIQMSNLGGINYGTTYSKYYTIDEEMEVAANAILKATNCTAAESQVDCLRAVPAATLQSLSDVARYLVVDGTYLTTDELQLDGPRLPINLMMGIMADDGAPFISFPTTTNQSEYLAASGYSPPPPDLFPIPDGANKTLDLYNMTSRLATDGVFRCVDQATVKRGTETGRLGPGVYYYEFDRSYQGGIWPNTDVCEPAATPEFPHGDPSLPYFRCHGGELHYAFGNLARQGIPDRDGADTAMERVVLDSWAAFARTANPNPEKGFLVAKGFESTIEAIERDGKWEPAVADALTMRVFDWPTYQAPFRELPQCEALGLGLDYYG